MYTDNNKVYPTLPSAPEDDTAQKYRLQKVSEIEAFFLHEMEEREKLAKKVRRIGNSILIADTGLIITTVITGSTSIAAFASGVVIPVGIALTRTSLLLINCNNSYPEESFSCECEAEKTRGDSIISSKSSKVFRTYISKALTDGHVSDLEFERILSELERYRTLKQELCHKAK